METNKKRKVLVYGATGSQSGLIPGLLSAAGYEVRVLLRPSSETLTHQFPAGTEVFIGDLADYESLLRASQGVDAVSLQIPFFGPPNQVATYGRQAIDAAVASGVKQIVWNSSGSILPVEIGDPSMDVRLVIFRHLEASGIPHIILEPSVYMENLLGPWTAPAVKNQHLVRYPTPEDMPVSWIATQDVSALVVEAIKRPELGNRRFAISGPENLTGSELAKSFSTGLGLPLSYDPMPPQEFGGILDQLFGPGAGTAATAMYQNLHDHPEQRPNFHQDMVPVLALLPIKLTTAAEWVASNKSKFGF